MIKGLRATSALLLLATLTAANANAAETEKGEPVAKAPPLEVRVKGLEKRAITLSARDVHRVVPAATKRAMKWIATSLALARKGQHDGAEQSVLRATLQLDLAEDLLLLASLKRRIHSLTSRLRIKEAEAATAKDKLAERDEYLNLLKVTR